MVKDITYSVAEFLFAIMSGEPLIGSALILLWIVPLVLLASSPVLLMTRTPDAQKIKQWLILLYAIVIFPSSFIMAVGVPLAQVHMLSECKQTVITLESDDFATEKEGRVCRHRDNFYSTEYGEWNVTF